MRDNRLIIQTHVENITATAEFLQPFFTLNADTANIKSATAPLVMDQALGGDGILSPGEQTSRLTFEVTHKNKPFRFFVDASAYVREIRSMWPVQLGSNAEDLSQSITTDRVGNVYVSGYTKGGLLGNTSAGSRDAYLTKYAADGNLLWIKQFGSPGDEANSVATDPAGNVYVSGYTESSLPGNTSAGGFDAFLTKYAPDVSQVWPKQFGSAVLDFPTGVATNLSGNVCLSGLTDGSLPSSTSAGGVDAFIAKYDSSGAPQ